MFKEVYNQMFRDLFDSLHQELKNIQQSDNWIGFKLLSSLIPILATLMGIVLYFVPIVIIYVLAALLIVLLIPFHWIFIKAKKILRDISRDALL